MPRRITIIILLFSLGVSALLAQPVTEIKGTVLAKDGEPILGANVFLAESYDGTTSGEAGAFSFTTSVSGEQLLKVSFLGYREETVPVRLEGRPLDLTVTLAPGAFELEDIVITAGSFEAGGEDRREVLKPLDIVSTAGATADLAGVFNTLPGTQVVGEEGRLFVRGGEGRETKTFIDGMQVRNFYSPAAPNTPSRSRFLPFMFSGASFSTGGYSAEYGQALSSALILQSKPVATQNRVDVSLMSVGADIGFTRAWETASLSGKAQYTNIDPYFSLINQEIDWIDPPTSYEASLAYRKQVGSTGIIKVFGHGNYSAFQLNDYSADDPQLPVPTAIRNRYLYFNAVFHDELSNGWNLRAGGSLTNNQDRIGLDRNDLNQSDLGVHAKAVLQKDLNDQLGLKLGAEYFVNDLSQGISDDSSGLEMRAGLTERMPALFAESDIRIAERWMARLGLRSAYAAPGRHLRIAPRLSVAYRVSANAQLSAAFGKYYQAPATEFALVDPRLQPEAATHYILNYQIQKESRIFRAEAYYKSYDRLVRYDPDAGISEATLANSGSGYARGIDLFWRDNQTIKGVDYWVSYSYLDTRRHYRDFPYAAVPGFASRHNFSLVCKQFISVLKSQVGGTFRYAAGRPFHDPNLSGFHNRQSTDYIDLSLNLSYLFKPHIILHLSATNVLGRDHVFGYEFASQADENGHFNSRAVRPPARRFLFAGLFITLSKEDTFSQLPNL